MRPKAFSLLPQLQYLDGVDRHGNAEDEDDQPVINGTLSDDDDDEDDDDNSDGDDELDEEEVEEEEDVGDSDDDGESEDDDRLAYNEEVNGATEDYNDQGSEAEDEDDDDDEDTEAVPVVRGKKRKFDSEDLLQWVVRTVCFHSFHFNILSRWSCDHPLPHTPPDTLFAFFMINFVSKSWWSFYNCLFFWFL